MNARKARAIRRLYGVDHARLARLDRAGVRVVPRRSPKSGIDPLSPNPLRKGA